MSLFKIIVFIILPSAIIPTSIFCPASEIRATAAFLTRIPSTGCKGFLSWTFLPHERGGDKRRKPQGRVWGRHSPTSFPRGAKPQNCGFWHRGRNLLSVTANFLSLPSATFSENRNQKNSFLLCLLLVHQEPVLASCFSFSATNNPAKDIPARFR